MFVLKVFGFKILYCNSDEQPQLETHSQPQLETREVNNKKGQSNQNFQSNDRDNIYLESFKREINKSFADFQYLKINRKQFNELITGYRQFEIDPNNYTDTFLKSLLNTILGENRIQFFYNSEIYNEILDYFKCFLKGEIFFIFSYDNSYFVKKEYFYRSDKELIILIIEILRHSKTCNLEVIFKTINKTIEFYEKRNALDAFYKLMQRIENLKQLQLSQINFKKLEIVQDVIHNNFRRLNSQFDIPYFQNISNENLKILFAQIYLNITKYKQDLELCYNGGPVYLNSVVSYNLMKSFNEAFNCIFQNNKEVFKLFFWIYTFNYINYMDIDINFKYIFEQMRLTYMRSFI
ncbi:hypothetical protein HERIO_1365 [Hepatospora eriocheir]|uniref:Uncharacterized protein n=1 Tax=Hepatospora eriocheir TaxID=1081669 RepID=A0A1X0QAE3_9MICR|nr:hypothetical protein HERIO_1365 [Hepatospora eriocheir]